MAKNYFAKNIRYLRTKRQWEQIDLAKRLNYKSLATISRWERGLNLAPMQKVTEVADIFGVSADDLMNTDLEEKEADDLRNLNNISVPAARPLPILGTICAGNGIDNEENFDGLFFIDNTIRADMCVYVKGDSMIDVNIFDGDIAMIKRNCEYMNGYIYAVRIREEREAVLKVVYWQDGKVILSPRNKAYSPMIMEEFEVTIIGMCAYICHETVRKY